MIQAYKPGRVFLGILILMFNKMGGIRLIYYDDVPIKEVLFIFMPPSSLLPHKTGRPRKRVREVGVGVQDKPQL